jgi:CubicO group peptidase (beta-lactamase class C family)
MARPFETVTDYLNAEIARGSFPGAAYLIADAGEVAAEDYLGHAVVEPERIAVKASTIFDLASLTKPLITSMLAVMYAERNTLDLSGRASDYIPELRAVDDKKAVTVTQLLTHTSGLERWRPFHRELADPKQIASAIASSNVESSSSNGSRPVAYSDLNYILLGILLERIGGARLDALAQREILAPLRLGRTMFNPPRSLKREIAATETITESEDADPEVVWGRVHDPNTWFLGGVSGHAGLFSTAREAFKLATQFLKGGKLVSDLSLALFTENLTRGDDTARSLGWVIASSHGSSAGPALPQDAIGHTGFTGTSIWMDTRKKRVLVLLTNRLHPRPADVDMQEIRRTFNTLAVQQLEQEK